MVKRNPIDVKCNDCRNIYQVFLKKPCDDGKFRCKICARRRMNKRHKDTQRKLAKTEPYRKKARAWRLKNVYGLSEEDYNRLLERQAGRCSICKEFPSENEHLVVDHDHTNGKVRGLLCQICNRALGHFRDNIETMHNAVSYILRTDPTRSWDRYFLDIASLVSTRSKDPSTQIGAVVVMDKVIISTGYNGLPRGVNDNVPERYERPLKYQWMVHAEENAILNAIKFGQTTVGASIYVTALHPCVNCAKSIVQSGIKEVIVSDKIISRPDLWDDEAKIASQILSAAKVLVREPE